MARDVKLRCFRLSNQIMAHLRIIEPLSHVGSVASELNRILMSEIVGIRWFPPPTYPSRGSRRPELAHLRIIESLSHVGSATVELNRIS